MKMKKKVKKSDRQNQNKSDIQPEYIKNWKILVFLFIVILYGQVINFDFVYLDDDKIILDHYDKISSLSNIPAALLSEYGFDQGSPYYRPVIIISLMVDAQLAGKNPLFYHLSNLLFHLLTTFFLFILLNELKISKKISFFLVFVFAAHPLLTNAIVWIAGRNDLLAAMFSLLSVIYFIKYFRLFSKKNFLLHITFFCLAVFSKEVALILPILYISYLFFYSKQNLKWRQLTKFFISWSIIIILFQVIRTSVISDTGNLTYGVPALINNIQVIPEIIFKIFLPINISVLPTFTVFRTITGTILLGTIILLPLFVSKLDKKKYYFGIIWFLIFIVPGLFIYYADQSEKFDYLDTRVYLPFIGFLIVIGELTDKISFGFFKEKKLVPGGVIIILLSIITFFQSKKYENAITFAESAILSNTQRPFFYHKLADYYFEIGDYKKAADNLETAIQLSPEKLFYYKNLILAYSNLKEYDKAINAIYRALKIKPNDPEFWRALIMMYYNKGDHRNALLYADKYISLGGSIEKDFYEELKGNRE